MNDKTMVLVQHVLNQMTDSLSKAGTVAWHTYLAVIQATCTVNLVQGIGWMLAWLIMFLLGNHYAFKFHNYAEKENIDTDGFKEFLVGISYLPLVGLFIVFFTCIFDVWNWIGIFNPQLYAAHEIVNKVLDTAARSH